MDCFLQFKSKSHRDARAHEAAYQLTKRAVLTSLLFLIYVAAGLIILFADTSIVPVGSKSSFAARIAIYFAYVVAIWIIKYRLHKLTRQIHVINIVLDIVAMIGCLSLFPLFANVNIKMFGTIGLIVWQWSFSSLFFSIMLLMMNWWVRILSILIQITWFMVFVGELETHKIPLMVFGAEAILFYVTTIYFAERYDRNRFVKLLRVKENLEATQKIFDNLNEGIAIFDKDLKILYANRAVSTLFDVEETTLIDKVFDKIKIKTISPAIESCQTDPRFDNSQIFNGEQKVEILTVEGHTQILKNEVMTKKNYVIKLNPTLYMNKQVIVATIFDTTVRDALISAQDSNNYKSRLLASVSHELRTPLNGSINFTEQALSDPTVPERIKQKWLLPALRSNRLLLSLINDILDFSQINENKLRLVFATGDVASTARECIELLEIQAEKKGIELTLCNMLSKDEALICTDHNRLRQIILNLLSNAVKFTFQGSVTLKIEAISTFFEDLSKRKGVKITCQDTGIGISEEGQKKLFKAFEKIELGDKIALNSTGVGLGLVISNNLVQRLNSPGSKPNQEGSESIQFKSKVDEGSSFFFEIYEDEESSKLKRASLLNLADVHLNSLESCDQLDMYSNQDDRGISAIELKRDFFSWTMNIEQGSIQNQGDQSNLLSKPNNPKLVRVSGEVSGSLQFNFCVCPKILIVDDDPFNLTALEQHITKLKFKCEWAFNGKVALEKIRKRQNGKCSNSCSQYAVVFLDCNMPVMDGFQTSKELRRLIRNGELDDLKIIACTAFIQQSELDQAKTAGMDDFCTKPISLAMVKEKLNLVDALKRK